MRTAEVGSLLSLLLSRFFPFVLPLFRSISATEESCVFFFPARYHKTKDKKFQFHDGSKDKGNGNKIEMRMVFSKIFLFAEFLETTSMRKASCHFISNEWTMIPQNLHTLPLLQLLTL